MDLAASHKHRDSKLNSGINTLDTDTHCESLVLSHKILDQLRK